ncbi:MAG: UDP-N-acetyl-2-amino-2-deoxyglucuronate dehydrogenase [Gammaproteobacteria bacterium]|nr:UDP-N-acetyl-2-amino-2-deoxyglucuronate dehydrogenase [Gammaproteobacteria bacterium]
MTRLRVGILGSGGIAARHAGAVATFGEQLQLVACCGRNEHKVAEFATKFDCARYTDFERMVQEQRLDLLIVALPPYAHSGQVEKAAATGVHLLVEKPIALTLERALSMVNAVKCAGVVAACGFMYRFGDAVLRWDAEAVAGTTGRAGMFVGQFHCNALHADWWREQAKSGGQVVEQLIHIVDLARHQLGEPQSVYARGSNFFHRGVNRYDSDDVSAMILGYDDGRVGVLNATNGAIPGKWDKSWQVVAERMSGQFTGWNTGTLTRTQGETRVERIDTQTDVFAAQLADITGAISSGRPPRVTLDDGAQTLRIVLAARSSIAQQREIRL